MATNSYTLTKIKSFRGMEGYGLNATICRDGKAIAFMLDEGNGGMTSFDFRNPGQTAKSYQATTLADAEREEKAFGAFVRDWFQDSGEAKRWSDSMKDIGAADASASLHDQMDAWVNKIVDAAQERKQLDRLAKTKTLFRLKSDKYAEGEWRTIKAPYSEKVQKYLDDKYPSQVAEIYGVRGQA